MAGEALESALRRERRPVRDQSEILKERFERLPAKDQSFFRTGPMILALNSSFCGLIATNYLRTALNVTQGRLIAALPMVFLPFTTTLAMYEFTIGQPLMQGKLNCATCASVRGGLIGAFVGCLYPAFLAIPLTGGLAAKYSTAPLPSKENMFRYWMAVCKPAFKRLRFAAILQAALGTYFSSKQYEIYIKMLKLPESGRDPEILNE